MSSAANQKWARFPHRGTIPVHTYAILFASPIIHLSGRNIFRPDVGHWWRVTALPFLPHITFCTGEKYFAPTFAIVTLPPDRRHRMCQSSICSRTSSHPQPSICRGEIFFARTSAIGGAQPPVCFCPTSFLARAKYFLPLHLPLLPCCQITIMAAVNHQYVRNPLCIPNHPIVGAKYFSPGHRPLVAPNTLLISAPHHLWHGRNIFRPYVLHRWRVTP